MLIGTRLQQRFASDATLKEFLAAAERDAKGPVDIAVRGQREALKDMLASLAEKIVLDPASLECEIQYRIGIQGRNKLASPRGFAPRLPPCEGNDSHGRSV